jgi:alpha/beta superfamily hydrolase
MVTTTGHPFAERVDRSTGIRERAGFLDAGNGRIFGFTHLPPEQPRAAILICSPLYAEFTRNYRREVLMARRLASAGVAVQRFHYRGTGNSDGDPAGSTFGSMREDALVALTQLRETSGSVLTGAVGARYGGLVAAAVAGELPSGPIVLWDPIVDPGRYLREILRARKIAALKGAHGEEDDEGSSANASVAEGDDEDIVYAMGYAVRRALFELEASPPLVEGLRAASGPILLINLGSDPRRARDTEAVTAAMREGDTTVDVWTCGQPEPWWFTAGALVSKDLLTEPVDVSIDWLTRLLGNGAGPRE